ncbi:MAG: glycosyltransferase [Nitrospiraceae bacterium]|jgi:glycosyltransferase involved in cell wall biosynthesis|nr:glycosyltransferase [Nitrospiraceae bacterium]
MIPVLYLIEHLRQGGSERYVSELARSAPRMGVDPHVGVFSAGGIFFDEVKSAGIPLTHFPIRSLYHPSTISTALALRRYIRTHGIRIVHSFQPNANILGTLIGRLSGARVVISRRNLPTFGCLGSLRLAFLQKWFTNPLAHRVLANSQAVLDATLKTEGFPEEKVVLIYNGLDTTRFAPVSDPRPFRASLGIHGEGIVFGVVSGFRPHKGVDVVIRAFAQIHKDLPGSILLLAGSGPERARLEALTQELGVTSSIRFLGVRPDMEAVYPAFDVFILCSQTEGFSNAILEAMGMGLPVVVSNVGGNTEMIEDGTSGYLVPPGDPLTLEKRLLWLARNPSLRQAMGVSARKWVERTNARDPVYQAFHDLYTGVLDG